MAMLTIFSALLVGALLLIAVMVGSVWWRQERIAYQPPTALPRTPAARRLEYVADDGQPLFAYVVEPAGAALGVLLAFHGNADLAIWQIPWACEVSRRTGWCVLLAEYRGYGGLSGAPTYAGLRGDARAAWRATQQFAAEELRHAAEFALFGHSLGSGVASELASETETIDGQDTNNVSAAVSLTALLLESPFTSARDMVRIVSTRPAELLWRLIARVHYDTRMRLAEIDAPVWIAHGARDWLIPVSMGRELFARARTQGELLVVDDASHNDVSEKGGEPYWRWLSDALSANGPNRRQSGSTRRREKSD